VLQLQPFLSGTRRRHKPPSAATQWRLLLSLPSDPLDPALQRTPHRIVRHGSHDRGSFADDEKALPSPCTNHTFELLGTWITFWYLLFICFSVSILKLKKIKKNGFSPIFLICIHFAFLSFCLFCYCFQGAAPLTRPPAPTPPPQSPPSHPPAEEPPAASWGSTPPPSLPQT